MNSYYIMLKEGEKPLVIKDGFNWLCFFFGVFWSVYRGVWLLAGVFAFLLIMSLYAVSSEILHATHVEIFRFGAAAILSFYANDLLKYQLKKNGYYLADIIIADDGESALQRFLDLHLKKNQ